MLRPTYPIRTERLLLRPLTPDDLEDVYAYSSLEEVCRYIPYEPRSREDTRKFLEDTNRTRSTLEDEGQVLAVAMELPGSGVVGDFVLFWRSREHRAGEIGWVQSPAHSGRGYATEAARALLRLAFDDLGLHRVVARVDLRNEPSARMCRRLGMRQEAHLVENEWFKGEWSSELDFAILDREWERLQHE